MSERGKAKVSSKKRVATHSRFDEDGNPLPVTKKVATKKKTTTAKKSTTSKTTTTKRKRASTPKKTSSETKKASAGTKRKAPKSSADKETLPKKGSLKNMIKSFMSVSLGKDALERIGQYTRNLTKVLVVEAVTYAEHARRKTVQFTDIKTAVENHGLNVGSSKATAKDIKTCSERDFTKAKEMKAKITRAAKKGGATVSSSHESLDDVLRFDYSKLNCISMQKAPFLRMAKEYSEQAGEGIRWQAEAIAFLQLVVEKSILQYAAGAAAVSANAKRSTIKSKDVEVTEFISESKKVKMDRQ